MMAEALAEVAEEHCAAWHRVVGDIALAAEGGGADLLGALDELLRTRDLALEELEATLAVNGLSDEPSEAERHLTAVPHIPHPDAAIATVRHEHDRLMELIMVTIDLLGEVQEGRETVQLPNLRKAAGATLRKSLQARDDALAVLASVT